MAMVKQMLKSQSFKQCRLCCFVFLSSANIFVVPFLGKCLDIVSSQMLVMVEIRCLARLLISPFFAANAS